MLVRIESATFVGLEVIPVTIEVSVTTGVGIHLVGLPDNAVKESLLRVVTAISACGYRVPGRRIVINLAPADVRKEGSMFDCAIALGILLASGQLLLQENLRCCFWGELGLDGSLRKIPGALPLALYAKQAGFDVCFFPAQVREEALMVPGIRICALDHLMAVVHCLETGHYPDRVPDQAPVIPAVEGSGEDDFKWVIGQSYVKRGLEIAAAGAHNLLMVGPPGSGKSFMARCLASILPPMTMEESLETVKIYSVAGLGDQVLRFPGKRPFRAPHHTATSVSLTGGGLRAMPGEISLAHNGVLYLDELVQFPSTLLNELRQPLEERKIAISRSRYKVTYPASFMLVASMNPCPCGYYGDGTDRCTCHEGVLHRYWSRLSGPLMDRIDLQVAVRPIDSKQLVDRAVQEESSAEIAERVSAARAIQKARFAGDGIYTNAQMGSHQLARYCALSAKGRDLLGRIISRLHLSARGYSRLLKLARTLADLQGCEHILPHHLAEAAGYRCQSDHRFFSDML